MFSEHFAFDAFNSNCIVFSQINISSWYQMKFFQVDVFIQCEC